MNLSDVDAALESIPEGISFDQYWEEVCRRFDKFPVELIRAHLKVVVPHVDLFDHRDRVYRKAIERYGDAELKSLLFDSRIVKLSDLKQVERDGKVGLVFPPRREMLTPEEWLREIFENDNLRKVTLLVPQTQEEGSTDAEATQTE